MIRYGYQVINQRSTMDLHNPEQPRNPYGRWKIEVSTATPIASGAVIELGAVLRQNMRPPYEYYRRATVARQVMDWRNDWLALQESCTTWQRQKEKLRRNFNALFSKLLRAGTSSCRFKWATAHPHWIICAALTDTSLPSRRRRPVSSLRHAKK